jgi:hypothetical protein
VRFRFRLGLGKVRLGLATFLGLSLKIKPGAPKVRREVVVGKLGVLM